MNKAELLKKNKLDLEHSEYLVKAGAFFTVGLTLAVTIFFSLENEGAAQAFILSLIIGGIFLLRSSDYFNDCKAVRKKLGLI